MCLPTIFLIGAHSPPHWPAHAMALFRVIATGDFLIECAALFPPVKGQRSPWIAWSFTASLPTGIGAFTSLLRDIVAAYARPMARTDVRPRDVMGRRLAFGSWAFHGCSPVTPRWAHPSSFYVRLSFCHCYQCHQQRRRLYCRCVPWPSRRPQQQ